MSLKEKQTDLIQQNNDQRMTLKPEMIFGLFLGVTFVVITFNQGSNFYVPQQKTFPNSFRKIDVVRRDVYDIGYIAGKSHRRPLER